MKTNRANGFTIIELLTVTVIIALLSALVFAVVLRAKGSAKRATCTAQLRQIGAALEMYHESFGTMPPRYLDPVVDSGLLPSSMLFCPQDNFEGYGSKAWSCMDPSLSSRKYETSFETPLHYQGTKYWKSLEEADPNHGLVACRLHGDRSENYGESSDFCTWGWAALEGTVLRLRKDTSIQTGQFRLIRVSPNTGHRFVHFPTWRLWTDEPQPDWMPQPPFN